MARHKNSKGKAERRARAMARTEARAREIAEAKAVVKAETVNIECRGRTALVEQDGLPPLSDMALEIASRWSVNRFEEIRRA